MSEDGLLNKLYMENMALKSCNMEYEDALSRLEEENEEHKYLLRVYTDFIVSKGYELFDVIEYSKEREE